MTQSKWIAACAGLGVMGVVAWQTVAGDLNPPVGTVIPTGRTLSEIYDRISLLSPGDCCDNGPWQTHFIQHTLDTSNPEVLIPGSGLLHAVIIPGGRSLQFYSGTPQNPIVDVGVPSGTAAHEMLVLNIRFENGLLARTLPGNDSIRTTILYRLDGQ